MRHLPFEAHAAPLVGDDAVAYRALSAGPPILFCGGLATGVIGFHHQIAHLDGRYRSLAWEYRGLRVPSRESLRPTMVRSIAQHAADAVGIIDNERAQRVAIVGWSLGVQVALEIFRRAPQRVALLVLVSGGARAAWGSSPDAGLIRSMYPKLFAALEHAPTLATRALRAGARSPEAFTWARRVGLVGPGLDADLFAEGARSFSDLDVHALLGTLHAMEQHDATDLLPEIDVPTLVIGGDRDPFTSRSALERLVNGIRGAEYLLLPGAGHFALLDHAQHVNLRIDKLLSERGY